MAVIQEKVFYLTGNKKNVCISRTPNFVERERVGKPQVGSDLVLGFFREMDGKVPGFGLLNPRHELRAHVLDLKGFFIFYKIYKRSSSWSSMTIFLVSKQNHFITFLAANQQTFSTHK